MRAPPSRLLAAAKDLIERQQGLGLPLPPVAPGPSWAIRGARPNQREARALTEELLRRIAPFGLPKA